MWENSKLAFMVQEKTNNRMELLAKRIEALEEENKKLRDQVEEMEKHANQPNHPPQEQCNAICEEEKPKEEVHKCEFCESDSDFCRDDGDLWSSEYESCGEEDYDEPKAPFQPKLSNLKDAMGVTLKSGKTYESPQRKPQAKVVPKKVEKKKDKSRVAKDYYAPIEDDEEEQYKDYPSIPFPQRLKKRTRVEKEYGKLLKVLKQLTMTMPFLDLLKNAPLYGKFIKEILSNKRIIEEVDSCLLGHECSALFSKGETTKASDPGKFTIPCSIGEVFFDKPLADLGASVSVMPINVYHKLGLGGMKQTRMTLHLADGSTRKPCGVVENVPVRIGRFYIPCDFVVMRTSKEVNSPLIFGRPFLATTRALVDVNSGKLTLEICGEIVEVQSLAKMEVASDDPVKKLPIRIDKAPKDEITQQEANRVEPTKAKKLTRKRFKKLCDTLSNLSSSSFASQNSEPSRTTILEGMGSIFHWGRSKQSTCTESKDPG